MEREGGTAAGRGKGMAEEEEDGGRERKKRAGRRQGRQMEGGPGSGVGRMEDDTGNIDERKHRKKGRRRWGVQSSCGQKCKQLGFAARSRQLADLKRSFIGNCPCSLKPCFFFFFPPLSDFLSLAKQLHIAPSASLPPSLSPLRLSLPPSSFPSLGGMDGRQTMLVLSCPQCECSACPPRVPAPTAEPGALRQRCPPGRLPERTYHHHQHRREGKGD